jgi:hypothetical protein
MHRLLLLPVLLSGLLSGCPTDGGDLPDLTFDPAVDERGNATLDLGDVAVGTSPPASATITITNNTEEEITLGVDCDAIAGTPFNISCPASLTIQPAGSEDGAGEPNNTAAIGGALLANVTQ